MVNNMSEILEYTYENPNKKKIENGKALQNNMEIAKELITRAFASNEIKYDWECKNYNMYYGFKGNNYKFQIFKDRMWEHESYRGLIKLLQKTGIMKLIKKVSRKG